MTLTKIFKKMKFTKNMKKNTNSIFNGFKTIPKTSKILKTIFMLNLNSVIYLRVSR